MSNTATFQFAGGSKVYVQALANAGYTQQVTISPPSGSAAVFQGSGEGNVTMPLTTQGFLTAGSNGGQASFTVPGSGSQLSTYKVAVSYNKGSGFQPSNVEGNSSTFTTPAGGQLVVGVVSSEDATDNDYNDGVVYFTLYPAL
ncbi:MULTISPECIES: hypothetical protein [Myxococcus]|uniref:DUF4402 domain-containing protein n=1 Tax=Myxococcus landrumensis TaxID=2813577 RepID=A0ABX7N6K9_9BACT|nr:hypothetical protein [Myxococcus landrumus]QSQ11993.1 hypothetical protein JY572_26865 [Myxococcus landrumus]